LYYALFNLGIIKVINDQFACLICFESVNPEPEPNSIRTKSILANKNFKKPSF